MRIYEGKDFISIAADKNVTSYATADFIHTDLSSNNIEAPTASDLRAYLLEYESQTAASRSVRSARRAGANRYMRYT